MFLPQVDLSSQLYGHSTLISPHPVDRHQHFSLDTSGVAGFLGGDDAVSTMAAVHIYGNRRLLGWYNTPGSFQIAKRLSSIAKSTSFHGISPSQKSPSESVHMDPATLFNLDTSKGPKFRAAHSGTIIEETSYLAALFMKECGAWSSDRKVVPGRKTQPIRITIAELHGAPATEMHPACSTISASLFATIPIAVSLGACVLCIVFRDWCASSLILVGIIANGVSCLALGSLDFVFSHPEPAKGSPSGDGILGTDKEIVLLKGTESAVNSITRGRFYLRFSSRIHADSIWCCSILFFIQGIAQLLLIPQASLFGQIMFLISLGISGLYNAWVSSSDKEKADRKMLFKKVLENPTLGRYTLGTRTSAVVFMLLVLQPQDPSKLLDELLPNDTRVWKQWKEIVLEELRRASVKGQALFEGKVHVDEFTQQEQDLFELLYEDARAAYNGYKDYHGIDLL